MIASAVALPACLPPVKAEPLRLSNPNRYSALQLGFVKGKTDPDSAEKTMKHYHLSGLETDSFMSDGRYLNALGADYQPCVHIFADGRYRESIMMESGAVPYGYDLNFAKYKGKTVLMALYRDPMGYTTGRRYAKEERIDFFMEREGHFRYHGHLPLGVLSRKHRGLTSPFLVGRGLDTGIIFIARNDKGEVWDNAYLITCVERKIVAKPIPLRKAARCSCIKRYLEGVTE